MKDVLHTKLGFIERELQSWIDFDVAQRAQEGLEAEPGTLILRPPTWPTHGQLKAWIEALQEAQLRIITYDETE